MPVVMSCVTIDQLEKLHQNSDSTDEKTSEPLVQDCVLPKL